MMLGLAQATMCPGGPGCPGGQGNPAVPQDMTGGPTVAQDLQALQASASAGGYETNAGSYTVDPTTGAVTFTPINQAALALPSTSLIPGVSNTVLAIAAAAFAFVLIAIPGGRR
jgi:hypothetical protein